MIVRYSRIIRILYSFGFAVVNLLEAIVTMFTLGQWSPPWVMAYARWFALASFGLQKEEHDQDKD